MSNVRQQYASYIGLQSLLAAQHPLTPSEHTSTRLAERCFIIIHQCSELLSSQLLSDIHSAARDGDDMEPDWPSLRRRLIRTGSIALSLVRLLRMMPACCPPEEFRQFRHRLSGMSANDSEQFQTILRLLSGDHGDWEALERKLEAATSQESPEDNRSSSGPTDACRRLMRLVLSAVQLWRCTHVEIVREFIADASGTGGTSGLQYLKRRCTASEEWLGHELRRERLSAGNAALQGDGSSPAIVSESTLDRLETLDRELRLLHNG